MKKKWNSPKLTVVSVKKITLTGSKSGTENQGNVNGNMV